MRKLRSALISLFATVVVAGLAGCGTDSGIADDARGTSRRVVAPVGDDSLTCWRFER